VDDGVPTHAVLSGQPACAQGGKECSCGAWAWRLRPRGHEVGDGAGTGLARSSVRAAFVRKGRINADAKVNVGVNAGSSDPRRGSVVRRPLKGIPRPRSAAATRGRRRASRAMPSSPLRRAVGVWSARRGGGFEGHLALLPLVAGVFATSVARTGDAGRPHRAEAGRRSRSWSSRATT
jgi:hypothetical protein